MNLSINLFTTFDGVSQAPGAPDEDIRDGFTRGGWLMEVFDEGCQQAVLGWYRRCGALLLGRRTYDTFASHWPQVTDPDDEVAAHINQDHKYVVTSSPLPGVWSESSTVLGAGFREGISRLKDIDSDRELQVHGSIQLARTLHQAGLVDIYRFLVAPVVVGPGSGLFDPAGPAYSMEVHRSAVTSTGVFAVEMTPRPLENTLAAAVRDGQDAVVEA